MDLADKLRNAGLQVAEWEGWETNGGPWQKGKPVGIMHHHTAPPVPFPIPRLAGEDQGRIKCNINTKPDGTVWVIAGEACNYSSGMGSSLVLAEVMAGKPPNRNAKARGLADDTNGNPLFFNFENDHAGDGGPIPLGQYIAIVVASLVVGIHYGLSHGNTISHAEWTRRKSDPYWNASLRCIEQIRADMSRGYGMAIGPNGEPNWDEVSSWAKNSWTAAYQAGLLTENSEPKAQVTVEQMMVYLNRAGAIK